MKLVVSDAHEVTLKTYSRDTYVCLRCGLEGNLYDMFNNPDTRCTPHFESESSGWRACK